MCIILIHKKKSEVRTRSKSQKSLQNKSRIFLNFRYLSVNSSDLFLVSGLIMEKTKNSVLTVFKTQTVEADNIEYEYRIRTK